MKKDIEWLKNEILGLSIKARHKENNQREWHMGHVMALFDVNKLIDQLDEPVKPQSLGKLIHKWECARDSAAYYGKGEKEELVKYFNDFVGDLESLAIVEPSKPVIPQFVADWIDTHNLYGNNPLREYRDLESDFNEGWTDEKDAAVYHWVNKNPYAFIDALRYGYESEKEKRYHVVNKENYFMLRKYDGLVDILRVSSSMSRDEYGKVTSFMLTEKEIKDYDERYWAFAEEVTQ